MNLSKTERLILSNQYRIMAELLPDERESLEVDNEIVERGYEALYQDLHSHIYEGMSKEDCQFVFDTLDMFRMLSNAVSRLDDRSGIDVEETKFSGFDGNEEGCYLSFTTFLMEKQNRWTESRIEELNSHFPRLQHYSAMIEKWKESADRLNLTKDDVVRIVG